MLIPEALAYKGQAVDIKKVGQELGVRYVLEGSVRRSVDQVRIAGQLIDAASGMHLWADRIDGRAEDIFDLQDRVTSNVVGAIAPMLELAEIERAKRKPTNSLDAYDHFLRGMAGLHRWSLEGNDEALSNLRRALAGLFGDQGHGLLYGCDVCERSSAKLPDFEGTRLLLCHVISHRQCWRTRDRSPA